MDEGSEGLGEISQQLESRLAPGCSAVGLECRCTCVDQSCQKPEPGGCVLQLSFVFASAALQGECGNELWLSGRSGV